MQRSMVSELNDMIEPLRDDEKNLISDGYHTFGELYDHRCILYISFLQAIATIKSLDEVVDTIEKIQEHPFIWRTRTHSDGSPSYEGWFVLGCGVRPGEQITYHIPDRYWKMTSFAPEIDKAPEWDKHTSQDVYDRLFAVQDALTNSRPA